MRNKNFKRVDVASIRKQLRAFIWGDFRTPTMREETLKQLFLDSMVVVRVIASQVDGKNYHLDLSDTRLLDETGLSSRRLKTIRLDVLKKAGVIWFPESSRPKKLGDYPNWMFRKVFLVFKKFVRVIKNTFGPKPHNIPKGSKYVPQYHALRNEALAIWFKNEGYNFENSDPYYWANFSRFLDQYIFYTTGLLRVDLLK